MNRETSVYLDLVRFLAAFGVFMSHVGSQAFSKCFVWQAVHLGEPAVVIFFVLSGFVIGYISESRETTGRSYAIARLTRLYSVVVPAIVVTALFDRAGAWINPEAYTKYGQLLGSDIWTVPVNLIFVHMSWLFLHSIGLGSDGPYWSLGYEAVYYVLFGLFVYVGNRTVAMVGCLVLAALIGPRVIELFPMWLLGLAAFRLSRKQPVGKAWSWVLFGGSSAGIIAWLVLVQTQIGLPVHSPIEVAEDYLMALLFAVNMVSFSAVSPAFGALARLTGRPIQWLAGATFTLYLMHYPILVFVRAVAPWPQESWPYRAVLVIVPLCTVFAVAQITERKKEQWRRPVTRMVDCAARCMGWQSR